MSALLTPAEAAKRLGVSPRTIRDWAQERRIQCVKVGRLVRFTEDGLEKFVRRSTVEPLKEMQR